MSSDDKSDKDDSAEQIQTGRTAKDEVVIVLPAKVFAAISTDQDVVLTFSAVQARKLDDLAWMIVTNSE